MPDTNYIDDTILTKAKLRFNDGSEMVVDIGQINLYHGSNDSFLEFSSGSGSSDGSSRTSYRVLEDISLLKIESPLFEKFDHRIEMKINNNDIDDIEGLLVEKDSILNFSSQITPTEDIIERYTRFDIHPELTFAIVDGSQYSIRLYNTASVYHSYSFMDLYRYVKAKEAM